MRRLVKSLSGRFLNVFGMPGFIQPTTCSDRLGVPVEVKVGDVFTEVAVQNVRLLFHRLTGRFDGVVVDRNDCQTRT